MNLAWRAADTSVAVAARLALAMRWTLATVALVGVFLTAIEGAQAKPPSAKGATGSAVAPPSPAEAEHTTTAAEQQAAIPEPPCTFWGGPYRFYFGTPPASLVVVWGAANTRAPWRITDARADYVVLNSQGLTAATGSLQFIYRWDQVWLGRSWVFPFRGDPNGALTVNFQYVMDVTDGAQTRRCHKRFTVNIAAGQLPKRPQHSGIFTLPPEGS